MADIFAALENFAAYHQAIIKETGCRLVYEAKGGQDFLLNYAKYDRLRTSAHDQAIASLTVLNKLAEKAGLGLLYSSIISYDQPFRRQIADQIIILLDQIVAIRL